MIARASCARRHSQRDGTKRFTIEGETAEQTIAKLAGRLPSTATISGPDVEEFVSVDMPGAPYPRFHHLPHGVLADVYGPAVAALRLAPASARPR